MFLVEAKHKGRKVVDGEEHAYWRIRNPGAPDRSIGWQTEKRAQEILRIAAAKETLQQAGLAEVPRPISKPSSPVLKEYLHERVIPHFIAQGRAEKSIISAKTSIKHLERLLGNLTLKDVTAQSVDAYVGTRRREGAKGRTIQIEFGPLHLALRLAKRDGYIEVVPQLQRPCADDSKEAIFLTEEQALKLFEELPWTTEPASALAIYASLELGWRKGECLTRRWEDVRWNQGSHGAIHVGSRLDESRQATWKTKKRRARTIALTAALRQVLQEWWMRLGRPQKGWVFPSPYHPESHLGSYTKGLKAACARAKIPVVHPHALRHSWATRAAIIGVPRMVAMAIGGWTDPRVLEKVYQHSITEVEVEAVQAVSLGRPDSRSGGSKVRAFPMRGEEGRGRGLG
jgi:integrase